MSLLKKKSDIIPLEDQRQPVLHLWLGQRPVSEQAKKLVPLKKKKKGCKMNDSK